jgi:hypothetical protein
MYIALLIIVGIVSLYLGMRIGVSYGLFKMQNKIVPLLQAIITIVNNKDEKSNDQLIEDLTKAQDKFLKVTKK